MRKRRRKEELRPYPDGAREDGGIPELQADEKRETDAPEAVHRPMMLVYAGPSYFARQAEKRAAENRDAEMTGVYAGPGFFSGIPEGEATMGKDEKDENMNGGPAYNQEMPEYVPMDAVPAAPDAPKTQEGLDFFCPACGAKISLGSKFCPVCGASLAALWAETDENLRDSTEDFRGSGKDASDAAGSEFGGGLDSGGLDGDSVNG